MKNRVYLLAVLLLIALLVLLVLAALVLVLIVLTVVIVLHEAHLLSALKSTSLILALKIGIMHLFFVFSILPGRGPARQERCLLPPRLETAVRTAPCIQKRAVI